MYEIRVEKSIGAAHRLRGYKGKCERLHGHNWKIELYLASETLDRTGLVADFCEIKKHLEKILAPYDHAVLNEVKPFDRINPSSENMARVIFEKAAARYPVSRVVCWESETTCAAYSR